MSVLKQQLGPSCWRAEWISRLFLSKVLMGASSDPRYTDVNSRDSKWGLITKNQLFGEDYFYVSDATLTQSRLREGWEHIEKSCFDYLRSLEGLSLSLLVLPRIDVLFLINSLWNAQCWIFSYQILFFWPSILQDCFSFVEQYPRGDMLLH